MICGGSGVTDASRCGQTVCDTHICKEAYSEKQSHTVYCIQNDARDLKGTCRSALIGKIDGGVQRVYTNDRATLKLQAARSLPPEILPSHIEIQYCWSMLMWGDIDYKLL